MNKIGDFLKDLESRKQKLQNLVNGKWTGAARYATLVNPLNGEPMLKYPNTGVSELRSFINGLKSCPKSGLHNPFKNVERYLMLAQVSFRVAATLEDAAVADYFARLIQSVMPKSYKQCLGEVTVTAQFLKNFSGDQVRFLARGSIDPGDHAGQQPQHFRWPYGPVAIIAPFNFPMEIPALHMMGALYMGNRPLVKAATKVSVVIEQFLRLLHFCGLPMTDVDLIHCDGKTMNNLLREAKDDLRLTQFTGSSTVAEKLAKMLNGKIRIEDAGFDWKILGADIPAEALPYIAWQCDQDAYAASGQKCSAQSILFVPEKLAGGPNVFFARLKALAGQRSLENLTIGPVLTRTTEAMLEHISKLAAISGVKILFGGKPLRGHSIPACYGAIEPTAVYVPLVEIIYPDKFKLVTTEVFGPVQVVTTYKESELDMIMFACERMKNHLTAAVVSNDQEFIGKILGETVNGTTYAGLRARTTGAPQNHWFGPCGDPRGAGIGTPEAIIQTWSATRCIIRDIGPFPPISGLIQS
ncbi:MAG: aldehyde dehydrogenase family protein [Candidatus Falkowbacteria bacterium]